MAKFSLWQAATHCTGGPGNGARAFLKVVLEEFPKAYSLGIYNCRSVRGAKTTSMHGEGRAVDVGFKMIRGRANPAGTALLNKLLELGPSKLGIQCIIWNRRIYSAKNPNGARYNGLVPHYDHLHIEFTRNAGAKLTVATVKKFFRGSVQAKPKHTPKLGLYRVEDARANCRVAPQKSRTTVKVLRKNQKINIRNVKFSDGLWWGQGEKLWVPIRDLDLVKAK